MRTLIFIFSFLFLTPLSSQNQNDYDQKMLAVAEDTANKIRNKMENLNVAVWDFTSTLKTKEEQDELGEFISQDFSIHFANINNKIQVLDRDHFKQIMQEQGLEFEGYISPETAKRIGQFTHADAVVTGTVDVGYNSLILRIKIINIETSSQLAATKAYIPISEDLKAILKKTDFRGIPSTEPRNNTSEKENNTRNQSTEDCEKQNTGDYFIKNKSGRTQLMDITGVYSGYRSSNRVENNQTISLLNLPVDNYRFTAYVDGIRVVGNIGAKTTGEFQIEKCKSYTYNLGSSSVNSETRENDKSSSNRKKNYRICFNNIGSNRHSWGDIKVTVFKDGIRVKTLDVENGQEKCIYNLTQNSVYSYVYQNGLIGKKSGEVLVEYEKNMVNMKNH